MDDSPRLIEHAFPLRQASIDSVHEKNVRHGHISTLHIWPARRPLAACRAALIATLLPDPGTPEKRKLLAEKIGGKVVHVQKKSSKANGKSGKKLVEETEGGILHWGRESSPDLQWFREEIRRAYGGRAPKVLDPFAGGGAIPLEAMRLGCDTTANDINPVAWFILKCTLEYPQKLAGQRLPLPRFALESPEFMEQYYKAKAKGAKKAGLPSKSIQSYLDVVPEEDLSWHVRAWGWWILQEVRKELEQYYPTVDGNPTIAYLWARTVKCKNCNAIIPLLKTRWLCKKDKNRVVLTIESNQDRDAVLFGIQSGVPVKGKTVSERRLYDKQIGQGTMSRNGAWCPCCGKPGTVAMTKEDIQQEGLKGKMGIVLTSIVNETPSGKNYRLPTHQEMEGILNANEDYNKVFKNIPFGLPQEEITVDGKGSTWCVQYGFNTFNKLFLNRQLLAIGTIILKIREVKPIIEKENYSGLWIEAIQSYLACAVSRFLDFANCNTQWKLDATSINHSFARFALPISWDFAEGNPLGGWAGGFEICYQRICTALDTYTQWKFNSPSSDILLSSAIQSYKKDIDIVLTDPPYYDSISYAAIMDFFYVWLRRTLHGLSPIFDDSFKYSVTLKWNYESNDGELIDDSNRFNGDRTKSKSAYEEGMYRAFLACHQQMTPQGKMVIVFANKKPDAWETLVSATIRAGFIVEGSWPIQTEQTSRMRALSSAALSSSVWLVCKKRPESARSGWDTQVLEEMRKNIDIQLREFWDAGIRGPDFVWAATGPALEAYSKHPIVKKANEPGQIMTVSEFLRQVRRIVVDFVVGRVLSKNGDGSSEIGLDDVTTYYLLHRNDFGFEKAPAGASILYAISCGLSDAALASEYDVLQRTGSKEAEEEEEEIEGEEEGEEESEGKGSTVTLKTWKQRKAKNLGIDINGRPAPMIDRIHHLMHLWRAGDETKVNNYIDQYGLWNNATFHHLLQAIIELAKEGDEERTLLESISNHLMAKGSATKGPKTLFAYEKKDTGKQNGGNQ